MAKQEKLSPTDPDIVPAMAAGTFIPQITIGAFLISDAANLSLDEAASDRRMARTTVTCERGGIAAAISKHAEHPTPKLLIVEVDADPQHLFAQLDELAGICPPDTLLLLLGASNDVALYRRLIRSGISEYLVTPVTPLALIEAVGGLFDDETTDRRAPVTAFFGARGGCGASAMAQNTAWSLAHKYDTSVLLIDFDLASGTCALRLDLDAATSVVDALSEGERLDKAVLDRMILRKDTRFALLASPADLTDICGQDRAAIRWLIDVARMTTSHVVLDLPSGWSRYTESFLEIADQTVLVATPDLVSLRNCGKIARKIRCARPNDTPPRLVLSQVGLPRCQQITTEQFGKSLEMPICETIPFDAALFSAAENEGRLVAQTAEGVVVKKINSVARILSGQSETVGAARKRGFRAGITGLFS